MAVILGPILGFRGLEDGEWRTCALVVTEGTVTPPELAWFIDNEGRRNEGENASERTHLRSFRGFEVWRFDWSVQQSDAEQTIVYTLGDGAEYRFSVPATDQPLRVAYGSCAGFSSLGEMKKVGDKNAMWDVLARAKPGRALPPDAAGWGSGIRGPGLGRGGAAQESASRVGRRAGLAPR